MEVVCELVLQEICPGSVAFSNFGGGGSMVCVTLDLVRCAMVSYFSWANGTLGADGDALSVGMNTLGSEAGGWTGA